MTVLYLDCFSGIAGDMLLGSLIDAGVPFEGVRAALGSLGAGLTAGQDSRDPHASGGQPRPLVWTERVDRAGVSATRFCVRGEDEAHTHTHAVGGAPGVTHTHHTHRSLAEIAELIEHSSLNAAGKARALALFTRLGEVEASIHGTTLEDVHLHEVGSLDSIVDIVGAVYALDALGADRIVCSPLNVGSGTVRSAHGVYPVPAPATIRLLEGAPIYAGPQGSELVTPTGALLATAYADAYGPVPAMRLRRAGYGAGSRNPAETPNVLRVLIGEADGSQAQSVCVVEAEIDDMNPQIFGVLLDRLLAAGALDVFYTPIQMKKNRPGTLLTLITVPADRERLTALVFRETTTIGVRYRESQRECLDRETITVTTPAGAVRVKVARRDGRVLNAAPEFDDCVRLAEALDRPVKDIQALAMRAFLDLGA